MIKDISKIDRSPMAVQIYEKLKLRVVNGEYNARFRLKERVLAKEFGVSTVPVREALKLLESQGFVNIIPFKGAEVVDIRNEKYAKYIYEMRAMIECFSIEKAIENINPRIMMKIKKCLDEIEKLDIKDENNLIDFDFHRAIVESTYNPYILKIFDGIKFKSPYYDKNFSDSKELVENYELHKRIYDYIVAKDVEKAKQEIKNHLTHFFKPKT